MLYADSLAAQERIAEAGALLSARAAQFVELGERHAAPRRVIDAALAEFDDRTSDQALSLSIVPKLNSGAL